jgi:hypothetical protein
VPQLGEVAAKFQEWIRSVQLGYSWLSLVEKPIISDALRVVNVASQQSTWFAGKHPM